MSDEEEAERVSLDSFKTKEEANDMLHVYAAMLREAHLTENFGVKVGPDVVRNRKNQPIAKTWDVFLIVRDPSLPLPDFLHSTRFQFRHKPPMLTDTTSLPDFPDVAESVEDEEEVAQPNHFPKGALYEVAGQLKTLPEWAEAMDIKYATLMARLYNGWSLAEALTAPVQGKKS